MGMADAKFAQEGKSQALNTGRNEKGKSKNAK
jgi:hypothetical protein